MIHLVDVGKSYPVGNGQKVVLHPTTLSIPTHRNVALLGANGAGKSTLMRLIAGVEEADGGRIVRGASISWPLGFSGGLHGSLTGVQNAEFIARIYDAPIDRVVDFVSEFTELGSYLHMPVETYSSGMRARLAFGISFSIDFECYLIDEALSVGDQWFRDKAEATFAARRAHSGMLFVSHNARTVENYCDVGMVLIEGRLVPFATLAEAADFYTYGILQQRNASKVAPDSESFVESDLTVSNAGKDATALTERAAALIESSELDEAYHLLGASIALDRGASGAYYWQAHILRAWSRPGDAIDAIRKHLQISPANGPGHVLWSECLMDLNRASEALGYLLKGMDLDRSWLCDATVERCGQMLGTPIQRGSTKPDYSWVDWSSIEVPPEFKVPLAAADAKRLQSSLAESLVIHVQVVIALIHREILTRFGDSRLGYLWAVVQPLSIVGIMYVVYGFAARQLPEGVYLVGFLLTGFVSFRFFSETRERISQSIRGNRPLLYFRQVTLFSVMIARTVLEFLTILVVFVLLVGVSYLMGERINIRSPLEILWGFGALTLLGLEFGLIVVVLSKVVPAVENFSSGITRILFLISGLFFYANEFPDPLRSLLLLNPLFNILEFIREGYFVSYDAKYASMSYVNACVLVGAMLALSLKRVMYHRLLDTRS